MAPDDRQAAARDEHSRDLIDRTSRIKPVERLADENAVDARVLERDRLGGAGKDRTGADERTHLVVRFDGDHAREPLNELSRQPSGSGSQVEHACIWCWREQFLRPVEQRPEVGRPDAVVRLGDVAEGEAERALVGQLSASGPRNGYR